MSAGAGSARRRWLAVGHDLLQPVRAAQLMLDALRGASEPARRAEIMGDLAAALTSMEQLVGSVTVTAEVGEGAIAPQISDFVVGDVLDAVMKQATVLAKDGGIKVRGVSSTAVVRSDPVLLQRILGNFANNAIRYSNGGDVLIGCRRRADMVHVGVWDRGIGIAPEDLPKIFDEFFQGNVAGRDRGDGLGLGLSIVKGTAEVLGHSVYVVSRVGAGSAFTVAVPLAGGKRVGSAPTK